MDLLRLLQSSHFVLEHGRRSKGPQAQRALRNTGLEGSFLHQTF